MNILFKTPVRPSWYTVGMMVLLPYVISYVIKAMLFMCSCVLTYHMPQNKAGSSSSLVFFNNVYSNQAVLTWLESWVFVAQEVHWVVEDEHLIPAVGSSSLSNINRALSCYALLLYVVAKKGSCNKLVYCRTIIGTDWVNPENLGSTYGWLCTLVYTHAYLDVLLTMHLSIIYSLFPTWYTAFFVYMQYLLSSFLYMFQASQAHHQEV